MLQCFRAEGAFRKTGKDKMHTGLKKKCVHRLTFVWLFESLDEVRAGRLDPSKNVGLWLCTKEPRFFFGERPRPGDGLTKCVPAVTFFQKPKIEILKMTVWFVLKS